MALLSLITEQSTVPCVPTIRWFLGDHFGVDKKKSGDHFGVGIISGSIWGSFQGWGSFRGQYHFGGCTDPTVLWNPWQVPFLQRASRSELIPSQAQLSSQLGLVHVRFLHMINLEALRRSFVYNMKNKGPRMDPWGTPHLMVCVEEHVWLIWTNCRR